MRSSAHFILARLPAGQKRENGACTEFSREQEQRLTLYRHARRHFSSARRKSSKQCRLAGSRHRGTAPKRKERDMTELQTTKPRAASRAKAATGRLFVLELSAGSIHAMNPDGSDKKTIVTNCHLPDGIVVDAAAGHIYWTNMGIPNLDDGLIERADLDGGNRRVIVPQGVTHTPKQIHLDKKNGKLYW